MMDKICFTYDLFDVVDRIWNDNDTFKRLNNDVWKCMTTDGIGAEYDVSKQDAIDVIEDSVNAGETVYAIINRKCWQIVPTDYQKRYTLRAFMELSQKGWKIYTDKLPANKDGNFVNNYFIFTKKGKYWEKQDPELGEVVIWTQDDVYTLIRFIIDNKHKVTGYDDEEHCVLY